MGMTIAYHADCLHGQWGLLQHRGQAQLDTGGRHNRQGTHRSSRTWRQRLHASHGAMLGNLGKIRSRCLFMHVGLVGSKGGGVLHCPSKVLACPHGHDLAISKFVPLRDALCLPYKCDLPLKAFERKDYARDTSGQLDVEVKDMAVEAGQALKGQRRLLDIVCDQMAVYRSASSACSTSALL
ncbi:hypothetical protein HaLaN_27340 [Haematococcus lacustris]|uniref:Uncharacterized protein n=1 Tax=Haematococcus lacustris TaxID=44745 RepID=A0A6A0A8C5_HAELA|nr:hypothetical protein HaLaN_27340 [Haematococcus lacustris]